MTPGASTGAEAAEPSSEKKPMTEDSRAEFVAWLREFADELERIDLKEKAKQTRKIADAMTPEPTLDSLLISATETASPTTPS
jgi:hypothetical protein